MDPDVALAELKRALGEAMAAADGDSNDDEIQAWQEVGDKLTGLMEWFEKGGYLPKAWRNAARSTVGQMSREQTIEQHPQAAEMFGGGPVPG